MTLNKLKLTPRFLVQLIILAVLLIGLPLGSWYYLSSGLNYRLKAMEELQQFGELPNFGFATFSDQVIAKNDIKGKIVVSNFIHLQDTVLSSHFGMNLLKLHKQFDERTDVIFLVHVMDTTSGKINRVVNAFAEKYQLKDSLQCYFVSSDLNSLRHLAFEGYKMPPDTTMPYFAITDPDLVVRNHYDTKNPNEIKRLVEHIALLLPRKKERKIGI